MSARNFGIAKTNGPDPRGLQHPAHSLHVVRGLTHDNSNFPPLPAGSILKRGDVAQSAIDIFTIGAWALLISVLAVAVGVSLFILFFL